MFHDMLLFTGTSILADNYVTFLEREPFYKELSRYILHILPCQVDFLDKRVLIKYLSDIKEAILEAEEIKETILQPEQFPNKKAYYDKLMEKINLLWFLQAAINLLILDIN